MLIAVAVLSVAAVVVRVEDTGKRKNDGMKTVKWQKLVVWQK